jgi:hypothetical protein
MLYLQVVPTPSEQDHSRVKLVLARLGIVVLHIAVGLLAGAIADLDVVVGLAGEHRTVEVDS